MSITAHIINPVVYNYFSTCYQQQIQQGASIITAKFNTLLIFLGWIFLRFESTSWQWVRANKQRLYPQINNRPKIGDILRLAIQSLWLILIYANKHPLIHQKTKDKSVPMIKNCEDYFQQMQNGFMEEDRQENYQANPKMLSLLGVVISIVGIVIIALCITQPFTLTSQFTFMTIILAAALVINKLSGRFPTIILTILALIVSARYLWWRYSQTLIWDSSASILFGGLLVFAESYTLVVQILGYFQSIWPLNRKPIQLPKDLSCWPTVDIFIPTYDESLTVVKPTIYAALGLAWPKDKLNIYLLDDGHRTIFKKFAKEVGIHYIVREDNQHAKAGNINHALKYTNGDYIAIFDCDHVPNHVFLQLTMGWFLKDPKLAVLQTPHHFFSPDPFERNFNVLKNIPNENALFFGVIQDGNDLWNSTYFCGTSGILKRSALVEAGGFSTESVTEDSLTTVRLQRRGYTTAYLPILMSAGLAPESLSDYLGQRVRWARGMVQILYFDNPLLRKGLTLPQRLCYFNSIVHFFSGIPRLIFLTVPVVFLLFNTHIIHTTGPMLLVFALPHLIHSALCNARLQGKYRQFMWNEIYDVVLAWYMAAPTTLALINPRKGKFNVTAKGGLIEKNYADWVTAKPYIVLLSINVLGLLTGLYKIFFTDTTEVSAITITLVWIIYNLVLLGGAFGVDFEIRQLRSSHRVKLVMPAIIAKADGHLYPCTILNFSDNGLGLKMDDPLMFDTGNKVKLLIHNGVKEYNFPCEVTRIFNGRVGVKLSNLSVQQHIDFIQCTFARADNWILWEKDIPTESVRASFIKVLRLCGRGYLRLRHNAPFLIRGLLAIIINTLFWIVSFIPRKVRTREG